MNARTIFLPLFAVISCVAIPAVSFNYLTPPYFWIGCGYIVIALLLFFFVTSSCSKAVLVNLIVIIATLSAFEWYLYSTRSYKNGTIENVYDGKYLIDHPDLGYTLGANLIRPKATKYLDNKLIYQVSYSTNKHGLRTTMGGDRADGYFGCILVYGGSFSYGEGLDDKETLPWQLDLLTGGRHRVYNFGLHGYGPHQMLASLESGHTTAITDCKDEPVVIIYQAIASHVGRAMGLMPWDKHGPRYLLDDDGKVVHAGSFDETISRGRLFHYLDESYIFKAVLGSNRAHKKEDFDLLVGIVEKAREKGSELFNLQDFVVLYWDGGPQDPVLKKLDNHGLHLLRVYGIIPEAKANNSRYRLVGDSHPSALANEKIAAFIVEQGLVPQSSVTSEAVIPHPGPLPQGQGVNR